MQLLYNVAKMCSRTGMRSPFVVPGSRFRRIICSFASFLWCLFELHAFDYSKESYYNIVDICLIGTSTLANFNVWMQDKLLHKLFFSCTNCNLGIPSNGKSRVLRVKNVLVTNLLLYGNIYVGIHIWNSFTIESGFATENFQYYIRKIKLCIIKTVFALFVWVDMKEKFMQWHCLSAVTNWCPILVRVAAKQSCMRGEDMSNRLFWGSFIWWCLVVIFEKKTCHMLCWHNVVLICKDHSKNTSITHDAYAIYIYIYICYENFFLYITIFLTDASSNLKFCFLVCWNAIAKLINFLILSIPEKEF